MVATARTAARNGLRISPARHPAQGMGLAPFTSQGCPRVWERADKHTRSALGFSIPPVVRDNPDDAQGTAESTHKHPTASCHLTQFTQVAMAASARAGCRAPVSPAVFVENFGFSPDTPCVTYTLSLPSPVFFRLEALLEVVFQRGSAMHHSVPRDAQGEATTHRRRSGPSQIASRRRGRSKLRRRLSPRSPVSSRRGVQLNLRVASQVRHRRHGSTDFASSEKEDAIRRASSGGKAPTFMVPASDVPFHSTVLRGESTTSAPDLEALAPEDLDPESLLGPLPSEPGSEGRSRSNASSSRKIAANWFPSEPLDVSSVTSIRGRHVRTICAASFSRLAAWQFASPVRWIETQDLACCRRGGRSPRVSGFVEKSVLSARRPSPTSRHRR